MVTYRDDVDRTNPDPDDLDTGVDETLEGTYMGSEYPVKPIDEENDAPKFTTNGHIPAPTWVPIGQREGRTRLTSPSPMQPPTPIPSESLKQWAATDPADGEDDDSDKSAPLLIMTS